MNASSPHAPAATRPGSGDPAAAVVGGAADPARAASPVSDEDGSLVTEYGLLAIVAATVAAAVIDWASDGAMSTLFNALMRQARDIVGV